MHCPLARRKAAAARGLSTRHSLETSKLKFHEKLLCDFLVKTISAFLIKQQDSS